MERVSILAVHLFFNELAGGLKATSCKFHVYDGREITYLNIDTSGSGCLLNTVCDVELGLILDKRVHVSILQCTKLELYRASLKTYLDNGLTIGELLEIDGVELRWQFHFFKTGSCTLLIQIPTTRR